MHVEELLAIPQVREVLSEHYRRGIQDAVQSYSRHRAQEDALTGALGQALLGRGAFRLDDGRVVTWATSYTRLPSSGRDQPAEKRYGADGIFEIELVDDHNLKTRKSILFQAKKDINSYGDADLRRQAGHIASVPGGGLIVVYRPNGYVAVDARPVSRRAQERIVEKPLEEVLGTEFVVCTVGSSAYFYDEQTELIYIVTSDGNFVVQRLPLSHRIRTKVGLYSLSE